MTGKVLRTMVGGRTVYEYTLEAAPIGGRRCR